MKNELFLNEIDSGESLHLQLRKIMVKMKFLCFLWILIPFVIGKSIKEDPGFITVPVKYGNIMKLQHSFGRNEDGKKMSLSVLTSPEV